MFLRRFPKLMARVDLVALLDEWAARFFEELDYVREGNNATKFAEQMKEELPQVRPGRRAKPYLAGAYSREGANVRSSGADERREVAQQTVQP